MKNPSIAIVFAAALSLGACVSDRGDKQTVGTLIGAGLGGLAGSQIGSGTGQLAAVGAGVLLGGLLGNEVGRSLDKADIAYAAEYDYEGAPIKRYQLTNAWPKSLEIGSLKAGDTNVLTEKIVITYEEIEATA